MSVTELSLAALAVVPLLSPTVQRSSMLKIFGTDLKPLPSRHPASPAAAAQSDGTQQPVKAKVLYQTSHPRSSPLGASVGKFRNGADYPCETLPFIPTLWKRSTVVTRCTGKEISCGGWPRLWLPFLSSVWEFG